MIEMPPNPLEKSTNLMPDGSNRMSGFVDFCTANGFKTVLELGRDTGWGSTYFILKSGVELWSVDIDDYHMCGTDPDPHVLDTIPTYHKIIASDTGPIPEIDGKLFDMVFLDTSHGYEHTKYELARYYPMALKWFVVDDYHWGDSTDKGVNGACNESGLNFERMTFGNDIYGVKKSMWELR
jgi:hypothetical protein